MTDRFADLSELTERLSAAAERLGDQSLDTRQAATLIEECAGLAAEAGAELDRQAQRPSAPPASG